MFGQLKHTIIAFLTTLFDCARGEYQRALLEGGAHWSGSDLSGKARRYAARYHESRQSLIRRLTQALPDGIDAMSLVVLTAQNGSVRHRRVLCFVSDDAILAYPDGLEGQPEAVWGEYGPCPHLTGQSVIRETRERLEALEGVSVTDAYPTDDGYFRISLIDDGQWATFKGRKPSDFTNQIR